MIVVGLLLCGLAALVHLFIFYLESLAWTGALARKTFGTTPEQAAAQRELAFNQGFYNLFLAIIVLVGVLVYSTGAHSAGAALVFAGAGSMVAASLVLVVANRHRIQAAVKQGAMPLLGVLALGIGLLS